jgi:hypothetical protein
MEKLESMLAQWTAYKYQRAIPLSTMIIQAGAKSLLSSWMLLIYFRNFHHLLSVLGGFKGRHGFHNI